MFTKDIEGDLNKLFQDKGFGSVVKYLEDNGGHERKYAIRLADEWGYENPSTTEFDPEYSDNDLSFVESKLDSLEEDKIKRESESVKNIEKKKNFYKRILKKYKKK